MSHNDNHQCCGGHDHHHHQEESHEHEGCGCGHDHHHGEHQTIKLLLDDDRELECTVLDVFELQDKEYIALLPEGEETVLLYRFNEEEEEGPQLTNIEDEEEFQMVSEVFLEMFQDDSEEDSEEDETLE